MQTWIDVQIVGDSIGGLLNVERNGARDGRHDLLITANSKQTIPDQPGPPAKRMVCSRMAAGAPTTQRQPSGGESTPLGGGASGHTRAANRRRGGRSAPISRTPLTCWMEGARRPTPSRLSPVGWPTGLFAGNNPKIAAGRPYQLRRKRTDSRASPPVQAWLIRERSRRTRHSTEAEGPVRAICAAVVAVCERPWAAPVNST